MRGLLPGEEMSGNDYLLPGDETSRNEEEEGRRGAPGEETSVNECE